MKNLSLTLTATTADHLMRKQFIALTHTVLYVVTGKQPVSIHTQHTRLVTRE